MKELVPLGGRSLPRCAIMAPKSVWSPLINQTKRHGNDVENSSTAVKVFNIKVSFLVPLKRVFLPNCVFLPNMSVKVRFALVFCVLLLVLVDCCQASGGQDGA